jgi:hypothetical protein
MIGIDIRRYYIQRITGKLSRKDAKQVRNGHEQNSTQQMPLIHKKVFIEGPKFFHVLSTDFQG